MERHPEQPAAQDEHAELEALRARVAQLEARAPARSRPRLRSFFAVLLILVAAVLTPLSVLSSWASGVAGDTDRYVDMMEPLASDPDVQAAVTARVTDAVMTHLNVDALLADVAPADRPVVDKALQKLGGPLTTGVSNFVHGTVERFVTSDGFERVWSNLNRQAHASVVKALTGEGGGAVKLAGDTVTLDLAPVIDRVKQRLVDRGLTVAEKIPEIHTDFTLLTSDSVGKAEKGFRALELLGFWLPVFTVVVAAGGVLLAVRRRRALVTAALAMAVGAALLGLGLWAGRAFYLDSLPPDVSQPAAGAGVRHAGGLSARRGPAGGDRRSGGGTRRLAHGQRPRGKPGHGDVDRWHRGRTGRGGFHRWPGRPLGAPGEAPAELDGGRGGRRGAAGVGQADGPGHGLDRAVCPVRPRGRRVPRRRQQTASGGAGVARLPQGHRVMPGQRAVGPTVPRR